MRPNILSRLNGKPTRELVHAADLLHEKALNINPDGALVVQVTPIIEDQILQRIKVKYGNKGPAENARDALDPLLKAAAEMNYPIANDEFQKAFVHFVMSYVTEGFEGGDTTGTQMGNFQGSWSGGGFK